MLRSGDEKVRGVLTRLIAELGHAPSLDALADELASSAAEIGESLGRLHAAHALLLHPGSMRPWVVHPFALAPGSCWVETEHRGYWANCMYCGLGIAAAMRCDAIVTTRLGAEKETVHVRVRGGELVGESGVFHLSTPVSRWWDNVVFACSSFLPFRDEAEIDDWCMRHDLPKGAVLSMPALWLFAKDWYGDYLTSPWRKRSTVEATALFARHGLVGPFWSLSVGE